MYTATDYKELLAATARISADPNTFVSVLTKSVLGREIPLISLGSGKKCVLYVAAHHGMEGITAGVLLDFISEYLAALSKKASMYGTPMKYLFETRRLLVVPMLNPDGVEYALHGVEIDNPLRMRVLAMNGGHGEDFSHWQANARGVDLNHNYNAGFAEYKEKERAMGILNGAPTRYSGEYPESEPETAALCRLLRAEHENLLGVLTLHTQGEEIFCSCAENLTAKSMSVGRVLSRLTGYRLARPEGLAAFGGLTDWCIRVLGRPSYTLECGFGINPLPPADRPLLYARLHKALFTFPLLL